MDRKGELNPLMWRDDDARRREVPLIPVSELVPTLRASFDVAPVPKDMAELLSRLR